MHKTDDNISRSVSNGKKCFLFGFGRIPSNAAGKLSPPRAWIHLIFSRPSSTLVGLARHQAGWPWAEPMSRSSVYRRTCWFLSAFRLFYKVVKCVRVVSRSELIKLSPATCLGAWRDHGVKKKLNRKGRSYRGLPWNTACGHKTGCKKRYISMGENKQVRDSAHGSIIPVHKGNGTDELWYTISHHVFFKNRFYFPP